MTQKLKKRLIAIITHNTSQTKTGIPTEDSWSRGKLGVKKVTKHKEEHKKKDTKKGKAKV